MSQCTFKNKNDGDARRRQFLETAAKVGTSVLGAAFLPFGAAQAAETFKIGWVRPTTGRLAGTFAPSYIGGLIAIAEINASGGILGRQIERIEEDDEASPAKEPAIVRKLQEAGVRHFVGPTGSSQALASLAMTTQSKIIQATYANAANLGDGAKFPYHYQTTYNTDQQAEAVVAHMVDKLKLKKIGVLQENSAFGEQVTAKTREILKRHGLAPTTVEVYPINAPDLDGYVSNLQKSGAEGIIGWIGNIPNAGMVLNAMEALNWRPPLVGHATLLFESLASLVSPKALENVYGTYYKSLTWTDAEPVAARQRAYAEKIRQFPEANKLEIVVATSPYYDFLHLLKHVAEKEKSLDPDVIKRALDNVRNYPGMLGSISFTKERHTGIGQEDVVLASAASVKDPKSMGAFRKRA